MNKFWIGVAVLVAIALALLAFEADLLDTGRESQNVIVNDLETECRQGTAESMISLDNRRIGFSGHFPDNGTTAILDYRYRRNGDNIVFNVVSEGRGTPSDFMNDCMVSVRYDAETQKLEPGNYTVSVQHNGENAVKQVIKVE